MSDYQEASQRNATNTRNLVLAAYATMQAGRLSPQQFVTFATQAIAAGSARAIVIADQTATDVVGRLLGRRLHSVGLTLPKDEQRRLGTALGTVLADQNGQEHRIARLATAEPLAAGQDAYATASAAHGATEWTRVARPDACALCKALADGTVIPISKTMYRHPGCDCVQQPVTIGTPVEPTNRELTTGHGLYRRIYRSPRPGLTFSVPNPSRGRIK